jgi:CDP-glycerol glycerophosphotransferase
LKKRKLLEYFSCFLAHFLLFPIYTIFVRKGGTIVGFCSNRYFGGNIKYLYEEMATYKRIRVFFVTGNKKQLEKLKSSNVNAYYSRDVRNIPLFLRTDVWIVTQGPGEIPVTFRMREILKKLFNINFRPKHMGKWVIIWHGVSTKHSLAYLRRMFAVYDLALVPFDPSKSSSRKDEVSDKIKTVGYPRTDPLLKKTLSRKNLLKTIGLPLDRKNILYAPTWGQYHRNFLWENEEIFEHIEEFCERNNCSFLIRMHPVWYGRNPRKSKQLKKKTKKNKCIFHLSSNEYADAQNILYISDILITDWSSIASDFILLNRPILFLDFKHPPLESREYPLTPNDRVGYIVKSKAEFFQKLQETVDNPKLFEKLFGNTREAVIKKIYKCLDGNSSKRCAQEIMKLLKDDSERRNKRMYHRVKERLF